MHSVRLTGFVHTPILPVIVIEVRLVLAVPVVGLDLMLTVIVV